MRNLIILFFSSFCYILIGCSESSKANAINNKLEIEAQHVIDSIVTNEPDMEIQDISFVKTKMPALMADELKPSMKKTADEIVRYFLANDVSSKDLQDENKKKKMVEGVLEILKPFREKFSEYNNSSTQDYIFGLTTLNSKTDSTKREKRIYVLNVDNPRIVEKTKFLKNSNKTVLYDLQLIYGNFDELMGSEKLMLKNKNVVNNPIYQFMIND